MRKPCKVFLLGILGCLLAIIFLILNMEPEREKVVVKVPVPVVVEVPKIVEVPVPFPVPTPVEHSLHVVQKGDTLWCLSGKYLGDPHKWPQIWQLNKSTVRNPDLIFPGQVLRIP